MSTNQPRKPAGTPVGGQFAPTTHAEAEIDLGPRVHRSAGTIVSVGGASAIVGGGYRGLTPELDSAVDEAAASMAERFGSDVEIRFNSDRRRGGAWLVTHPEDDGLGNNTWVGISAQLARTREEAEKDQTIRRAYKGHDSEWQRYLDSCDGKVHISVYVSEEALRDRSLGRPIYGQRSAKVFEREVPDVAAAIDLVAKVSIAGDNAEIERRKQLFDDFWKSLQELQDATNERWAKAKQGLSKDDSNALRNRLSAEYNKTEQELVEDLWTEIDHGA
jgi:hypothetical protein